MSDELAEAGASGGSSGLPVGVRLERLRADHAAAVLAFEVENRGYFAARIADRGGAYFAEFAARHEALVADQETGVLHFHVLVDAGGRVIGRVNLVDVAGGSAELGYRIAESATGRGLATQAGRKLCVLAAREYGLSELRAGTSAANKASRAVLERTGFVQIGEPTTGDRPQVFYTRRLDG